MIGVIIAVTKFQCDRLIRYIVNFAQRVTYMIFKWLMPTTKVVSVVDESGKDVTVDVVNMVAVNHDIGIDNMAADLIGTAKGMTILLDDGSTLHIDDRGAVAVSTKDGDVVQKKFDKWEDLNLVTKEDEGHVVRVKDD